jgi:hypothetical protein
MEIIRKKKKKKPVKMFKEYIFKKNIYFLLQLQLFI